MVLFLLFSLGYLARVKRLKWKNALAAAVPLALIGWPLVAVQVINLFDLPEVTLFGTFHADKAAELPHRRARLRQPAGRADRRGAQHADA